MKPTQILVASLTAALALAMIGCSGSGPSSEAQTPKQVVPMAKTITGTVALRNPATAPPLSNAAQLKLALVDISQQPNATIADRTVAPIVSLPLSFSLPFKHGDVLPGDMYLLRARIVDGQRQYTMPLKKLVLTQGHPTTVDIIVVAQKTPSEDMLIAFKKRKSLIGGMQVTQDTALGSDTSRAWQTFRKNGELRFVITIVDELHGDKGRTHTEYSYKNSQPFVVVQKHLPHAGAAPSSIDRAGWDDQGKLVLHEHSVGDHTTLLSAADAKQLRAEAKATFKRVGGDKEPSEKPHGR